MKKIRNPWLGREEYDCFGCCPTNPLGVHMEFYEDGDYVVSMWKPQTPYQGWIKTMHGGILATLLDETAGWVVFRKLRTSGVTTHLDIRYKKSISTTEEQITIKGHIVEQRRNIVLIDVTIQNAEGEICVEGRATYFCMKPEKAKEMGFEACDAED
ncbi:MAG: PaaI family thioesterase [Bacteroidales bacterium]|nr:PaaI family thioesterase [Bacteroidales bacterium]